MEDGDEENDGTHRVGEEDYSWLLSSPILNLNLCSGEGRYYFMLFFIATDLQTNRKKHKNAPPMFSLCIFRLNKKNTNKIAKFRFPTFTVTCVQI